MPPSTLLTVLQTHPAACAVACCATAPTCIATCAAPLAAELDDFFQKGWAHRWPSEPGAATHCRSGHQLQNDRRRRNLVSNNGGVRAQGARGQGHQSPITQRNKQTAVCQFDAPRFRPSSCCACAAACHGAARRCCCWARLVIETAGLLALTRLADTSCRPIVAGRNA